MYYRNFTIREEHEWNAYVEQSLEHEIYQTWLYHSLNKEGEPLLFVYKEGTLFIALPLIKREISESPYYDLTSVYGYCGPISNIDFSQVSEVTSQNFKTAFTNFMEEEHCICVFSRLHPFLNQQNLLQNIGGLKENGKTIYIDLTHSVQHQINKYEKRLSRQIRSLRKKGYHVKEATTQEEIKKFTEMYCENMDRLNASPHYYFDEQYFTNLLSTHKQENKLLLIYNGPQLICGALVLLSNNIIRNHLSATAAQYLNESPSKLLTDEISMMGRRLGKKIFHLGGGLGGREDSLYKFKSYFSDLQIEDRVWCYINNTNAYQELVTQAERNVDLNSDHFPLYRKSKKKV